MDRRRITRGLFAAAGAALLCLALATCSNPIDIVAAVTTSVKVANNKFLKVSDFAPAKNSVQVPPSSQIWIEFDRDLDTSTVNTSTVVVTGTLDVTPDWTADYTPATRTLFIRPAALQGPEHYAVSLLPGLKGTDGSDLQNAVTWTFDTKVGPSGNILINLNDGYTNSTSASVKVTSQNATHVKIATSPGGLAAASTTLITTSPQFVPFTLPGTQGVNTLYCQFINATDSTDAVNPLNDSIVFDSVAPTVSAFAINSGAASTSSVSVTLSSAGSDATSGVTRMRFQNVYTGAWSSWVAYSPSAAYTLSNVAGCRKVCVQLMDAATNTSSGTDGDSIIYSYPTVSSATLNTTTVGTVTVAWAAASADTGTNSYKIYRRDYPSGGTYTYLNTTTGTSLNVAVPEGQLYYFHVTIYNAAAGEGAYSATSAVGFTSDIAVIYNTNSALANELKTRLGTNWKAGYSTISGTQPVYSVTLVPQSLVSTTYSVTNTIGGWPVIITPDATIYSNTNMTHNVTAGGHGIIAMGQNGARLLDTVSTNFAGWSYTGTSPAELGMSHSMIMTASIYANAWLTGNTVWSSPLSSSSIPTVNEGTAQMGYTPNTLGRTGVYRSAKTNPTDGWLYAQDENNQYHFPVIRQGRFLQWGFEGSFDRPYTGWIFLVNMTNRMDAGYY